MLTQEEGLHDVGRERPFADFLLGRQSSSDVSNQLN